jgi:hypothetical protein
LAVLNPIGFVKTDVFFGEHIAFEPNIFNFPDKTLASLLRVQFKSFENKGKMAKAVFQKVSGNHPSYGSIIHGYRRQTKPEGGAEIYGGQAGALNKFLDIASEKTYDDSVRLSRKQGLSQPIGPLVFP